MEAFADPLLKHLLYYTVFSDAMLPSPFEAVADQHGCSQQMQPVLCSDCFVMDNMVCMGTIIACVDVCSVQQQ